MSTVGRDEAVIREYNRHQEREDERLEQMKLLRGWATYWWPDQVGAALATPDSRFKRLTS